MPSTARDSQTADFRGAGRRMRLGDAPSTAVHSAVRRRPDPSRPLTPAEAEVIRIVSDARTPVFATVYDSGRRRYSYWRALDSATGRGGCYVALPTAECDALHAVGRIILGEPLTDPGRTTYRVRAAYTPSPRVPTTRTSAATRQSATRAPSAPLRAVPDRPHAA